MTTILVTGVAGYIGSHTCLQLLDSGYDVVGIDNYDNSSPEAIRRVEELAGRDMLAMHDLDIRDRVGLRKVFGEHPLDAVVHFAGLKAVGESVIDPIRYYDTNIGTTLALVDAMQNSKVTRLVFSSSCTVYGNPDPSDVPLRESSNLEAVSPYGRTKLAIEQMLQDICGSDPRWGVIALRYFNPIGAHPSGLIGEDPVGIPNNLLPYIMQVAVGEREQLSVFGDDYPTPDGTCVRDYIHVVDLADGHVAALRRAALRGGFESINLGTGVGSTVLEVLASAERAVGKPIRHAIAPRRPGDATTVYAEPAEAADRLGWRAQFELDQMCADHWNWQRKNPKGYGVSK